METSADKGAALPIALQQITNEEAKHLAYNDGSWAWRGSADLAAGFAAWKWLAVMALNFMYCGGSRMLGRPMQHGSGEPTAAQQSVLDRACKYLNIFITNCYSVTYFHSAASPKNFDGTIFLKS